MPPLNVLSLKKAHYSIKNYWIVTQNELDRCDIIYQHTEFELNRCSLSKVIEWTPNFANGQTDGRTNARTGVTLNAPPPFFEWWGHNKLKTHCFIAYASH